MSIDEEKAKKFFEWLDDLYPVKSFKVYGKDDKNGNVSVLTFHHALNNSQAGTELNFFSATEEELEYYRKYREYKLQGKDVPKEFIPKPRLKSHIRIDTRKRIFDVRLSDAERGYGYDEYLYYNAQSILESLGIDNEERAQYVFAVNGNTQGSFFDDLAKKRLLDMVDTSLNVNNGIFVMEQLRNFQITMTMNEYNTLIQYAIDSKVPMDRIAKAINDNEFNVRYDFKGIERFKSFGIKGIRPTRLHKHFIKRRDFNMMEAVGDSIDENDASAEFRKLQKDIKAIDIPPTIEKYGPTAYLLEWPKVYLLIRHINPTLKNNVRNIAVKLFELADPEHMNTWEFGIDQDSKNILSIMQKSGLMNRETYIQLYQKALNRNHNLKQFKDVVSPFISADEANEALEEISRYTYYPAPRGKWQQHKSGIAKSRIQMVEIPRNIAKMCNYDAEKIRENLKKQILAQEGIQDLTIKTDMTKKDKNGVYTNVEKLVDWMFGVQGKRGYMQMKGNTYITFPPQTPDYPLELVRDAFRRMEDPDYGVRE